MTPTTTAPTAHTGTGTAVNPRAPRAAPVISFDGVSKWFGPVVAVSDVTFCIGSGVTALLGPNGAGKSTVMRMLCGLTAPSKGTVTVLGRPPRGDVELYRHLGLVPQQESVIEPLTARSFVTLMARLSDVADASGAAADRLRLVELDPDDVRPLRAYSKGMRQRVKVAAALVHDPTVLVLDEPLNGLDPRQRLRMIALLHDLGAEGRCVVVSSHVLEEVERLASRIVMIAEGRLAAEGEFSAIRDLMDDRPHRLRVVAEPTRGLAAALIAIPAVLAVRVGERSGQAVRGQTEGVIEVDVTDVAAFRASIAGAAQAVGARLLEVTPLDDDLESVFRYLVSRRQ